MCIRSERLNARESQRRETMKPRCLHIRVSALATLVALTTASCGGNHTGFVAADPIDIEQSPEEWVGQKLRIHTKEAVYDVYVTEVVPPFVIGYDYVNGFHPSVKIDVGDIVYVERYSDAATMSNAADAAGSIFVVAVVAVVILLVVFFN